jgi:hypothetical protein
MNLVLCEQAVIYTFTYENTQEKNSHIQTMLRENWAILKEDYLRVEFIKVVSR